MGLLIRLAWRSLRHRPGQALLLLVVLSLSSTALALALSVTQTADGAWDRVFEATRGGHVTLKANYPEGMAAADREALRSELYAAQASAPGVTAASGPWPLLFTTEGEVGGVRMELRLQVRDRPSSTVDQPLLVSGRWLDGGDGVVLEDGLATTMRVAPGDTVTIAGRRLVVRGTAMTLGIFRFPKEEPALVWLSPETAAQLDPAAVEFEYDWIDLRLANPDDAEAFVPAASPHSGLIDWDVESWQGRRAYNSHELEDIGTTLLIAATMLAALTVSTAALLVAWRMAARLRQVGTLKAIGTTPWQITGALLIEYVAVVAAATAIGVGTGTVLAPQLARSVRTLYGAPDAPPFSWPRTATVASVALGVVVLATVRPALRGVRRSTVASLEPPARRPRRRRGRAWLADRIGLPLLARLGIRVAGRRPAGTLAATLSAALGIAMVIAGLAVDRRVGEFRAVADLSDLDKGMVYGEIRTIALAAAGLLLAFAAVNAVVTAVFAARDSARSHAILRALGATPRQTMVAFVTAQLGISLVGCLLGIPLGAAVFASAGTGPPHLPVVTYIAVVVGVPLAYALIVSIPAAVLARSSIAPTLNYE